MKLRIVYVFALAVLLLVSGCSSYQQQGALPTKNPPETGTNHTFEVQQTQPQPIPRPADTPDNPVILSLQEQQMLNMLNNERQRNGLTGLVPNDALMRLARLKSQDMVLNNYFSHTSPTYGSPFEMMRQAGITFSSAAENIAGNFALEGAHNSLMNSPGHRANILNPQFNQVGIGMTPGGPYGTMFVQMFMMK